MQELTKVNKRTVLSAISQLFDPLGWLGPIIITAKVLMQNLWIAGINWDEPLPPHLESCWRTFEKVRSDIEFIKIPRWIGACKTSSLEVHGFSDASERAYAACIYLVVTNVETTSSLMLAKTRVAPVKTLSMPRLELCGAHLLARLMKEFITSLQLTNISIFCWTDAQIVLRWLSDHPSKWTTFVATRVSDILDSLPIAKWNHVKTRENPADIAT